MKRIALFLCILTMLHAIETEDRVRRHEEYQANQQIEKPIIQQHQFTSHRDIITLIDEDFETGMPIEWTVIDGNNDGFTWTTGTTFDLYGVHPPNYGTAYAYYSDDDAGLGAPAGTEYLISPAVRCAGAESLSLSYSWGFNAIETPFGATYVRFHDDSTWTNWNLIAFYIFLGNGDTIIDLSSHLIAESLQIQYTYEDLDGVKGGAFGIDNVLLEAKIITEYVWDFETGAQGWTHTSGQTFPASWRVTNTSYMVGSYNIAPLDAGDSCMCIDSDGAGSSVWVHDTAMSPPVPHFGYAWWKWGINYQNHYGDDTVFVVARLHDGSIWQPWTEMKRYDYDLGQIWDSVDVSDVSAESIQVGYVYNDYNHRCLFAAFDNVEICASPSHDVGCTEVISPAPGLVATGTHDVIGHIRNFGSNIETFNATANIYDTTTWSLVFTQTISVVDLAPNTDTNFNFGTVLFDTNSFYYTEIFTLLIGDENATNDSAYTSSYNYACPIILEIDIEAACGDNQCIGVEFDGTYFYITGANNATDPNKIHVVDTLGNLIWSLDQPPHSTGWGWRDLCWDNVYSGPDRIDTLYGSVDPQVDMFSIDLISGQLIHHGFWPGPCSPNRALACLSDSPPFGWYYTANFTSDCWRFKKAGSPIHVSNILAMYGAAYDSDPAHGGWVWWHSQDDPGTGFDCQITQMDAITMDFTGFYFGYDLPSGLTDGVAGGLCFYEGYRGADVLFAIIQGTPHDYLVGLALRSDSTGIAQELARTKPLQCGFSRSLPSVTRESINIGFTTTGSGQVSLKIYNIMGRLVRTLVHGYEQPGLKQMNWDGTDGYGRKLSSGVYFLNLQAGDYTETRKILLIR